MPVKIYKKINKWLVRGGVGIGVLVLGTLIFPYVATAASATPHFQSLTGFPLFAKGAATGGMSTFLNLLYKYLIGVAVILAIVEIIFGGFQFMGSGASISSKEGGKNRIIMALVGLLLVLSPYLIFNLINPGALSLQIGSGRLILTPPPTTSTSVVLHPQVLFPTCPSNSIGGCHQTISKVYALGGFGNGHGTVLGVLQSFSETFSCNKSGNCKSAINACKAVPAGWKSGDGLGVACLKPSGGYGERVLSSYLPFTSYKCKSGADRLVVSCQFTHFTGTQ